MRLVALNPPTFYANKRWGYGRTLQLLRRFRCVVRGHDFGRFNEGIRHCSRGCGGMTTRGANCSHCGVWAGPMPAGWFGNLVGWSIGRGFLECPDCTAAASDSGGTETP